MEIRNLVKVAVIAAFLQPPLSASVISKFVAITPEQTEILRALSVTSLTNFSAHAFQDVNYFYLGANTTDQKELSLARAFLYTDTGKNPPATSIVLKPLAPEKVYLNTKTEGDPEKKTNPLYNATIAHMTIRGILPAVVLSDLTTVCLLADRVNGDIVYTNSDKINDASGTAQTAGIVGIAASSEYIFAAVKANGGTFGNANAGVAILSLPQTLAITPIDATIGKTGNKAQRFTAGTGLTITNDAVLHWDNKLRSLFLGLDATAAGVGVASGLLVAHISDIKGPILNFVPALPTTLLGAGSNNIIGFDDTGLRVKISSIKTMHTSTGKAYVLVAGNVYSGAPTQNQIFALPIVNQIYTDQPLAVANDAGRITNNDNVSQNTLISDASKKTLATAAAAKVGGDVTPGDIIEMHAVRDAVFMACAQGIFQSSAIFAANGLIQAWTPWQRVMGAVDPVFGFGIDSVTTNFWYLTQTTNPGDTVKATQWTISDETRLGNLRTQISSTFPPERGGVHQLFNFDELTPNFETGKFSMMVATGLQKVALIRTGKYITSFIPTSGDDFTTSLADNFKVFTDQALVDIGPISSADISRGSEGWLFVGGYNGLAVLRQSNGSGWTTLNALTLSGFTFKTLGAFKNIYKLVCDDSYLYVMTRTTLYRIALAANKFSDSPSALNAEIIAQTSDLPTTQVAYSSFMDFVVSSKVGILATTNGLYRTANGGNIQSTSLWTEVLSASEYPLGPVTHLYPKSLTKGTFINGGNLYLVAGDISKGLATIMRYNVADTSGSAISNTTIQPITEFIENSTDATRDYYYPIGYFRSTFVTDGGFGFHTLAKTFGQTQFLRRIDMYAEPSPIRSYEKSIQLDPGDNATHIGIPVQNTASGAWIVPGTWGIRINE